MFGIGIVFLLSERKIVPVNAVSIKNTNKPCNLTVEAVRFDVDKDRVATGKRATVSWNDLASSDRSC